MRSRSVSDILTSPQADVISCSPISVSGYSDDALTTVASRLVDRGVLVTIGVGESQNYGPYYSYTGAAGEKVLAVTSIQVPTDFPDDNDGRAERNGNWGPLNDLSIKPDISAPGLNIVSTSLGQTWSNSWYGSEAAAAYVAGIAALYIGQFGGRKSNPNFDAAALAMRIMSSGSAIPFFDVTTGTPTTKNAPVAQVGCGLVNASKVLDYTTSLSFAKFELNDTHHFERYQKVDITNNAHVDVTYTFAVVPGVGFETWSTADNRVILQGELVPIELNPRVTLPSGTFKIPSGKTKTAQ